MSSSSPADPASRLDRALARCGLADRSALGRLFADGPDLLDLLHRLSTADVRELPVGAGRTTVITTSKGRIVDRVYVHRFGDGVLLVAGEGNGERIRAHLDRFTFAEKTGLSDVTGSTAQLSLVGPRARDAASAAGVPDLEPLAALACEIGGRAVRVVGEDGYSADGVSLIASREDAPAVRAVLEDAVHDAGGAVLDADTAEAWRVLSGLPASGAELTEEHNPLEAGLRDAVSFEKGCYVGQEVVARLNTYDKVAREIVGLRFPEGAGTPRAGTALFLDGHEVGSVTSAIVPPGWAAPVALAYLKRREAGAAGTTLRVGSADAADTATRVDLPFVREGRV